MSTLRRRTLVSFALVLTSAVGLGACFHPAQAGDGRSFDRDPLAIRFENEARQHVHVYLVGDRREWMLGRVEAGAIRMLRIPEESFTEDSRFARLVVIAGDRVTLQAARHSGAMHSLGQPVAAILSQRWAFAEGLLTSHRR